MPPLRRSTCLAKLICATALLLPGVHAAAANESLLIENVTVVSPEQAQPLGNATC